MNIDDALAIRLSVYRNTWIDYDSIEKMSNEGYANFMVKSK